MHAAFDKVRESHSDLLDILKLPLKLHVSADFIGYIVCDDAVNSNLDDFCDIFIRELQSSKLDERRI